MIVSGSGASVVGASVCVYAHPEIMCAKTDSNGSFAISLPANAETGIQVTGSSVGSVLIPLETSTMDITGYLLGMPTKSSITTYYTSGNTPYPNPGNGFLSVFVSVGLSQTGSAGATVVTNPVQGVGPLYSDTTYAKVDPTLMSTSTAGVARFGAMPPGVVEIDVTCAPMKSAELNFLGWAGSDISKARVPIVDGFETHVGFGCY